jgi:5-methylcytosine-specific restriction endonuclease McrA
MGAHRRKIPLWVKKAVLDHWTEPGDGYVYCFHCMDEAELRWDQNGARPRLGSFFQFDHLIPVSRGGSDRPRNIVISCGPCNRAKSDKLDWIGPIERWKRETYPEEYGCLG